MCVVRRKKHQEDKIIGCWSWREGYLVCSGLRMEIDRSVGVMMNHELCEKVMEERRVSDNVMAIVLFLEEEVLKVICGNTQKNGRSVEAKNSFTNK